MSVARSPGGARSAKRNATPIVLAVLHPKGGVGRSTTVWQLGAELALRGKHVRIEDLDQGRHLTRVFERHPLGLQDLQLASSPMGENNADLVLLDTAPEAQRERAVEVLRRADWAIVPVKGPEASSVQALPMLMQWVAEAGHARVLGFLPTMYKPRRTLLPQQWAAERAAEPVGDCAGLASLRRGLG